MSIQENVQIVKDVFAAIGRGDVQSLLALSAEDIEWITPGDGRWRARAAGTRDWRICFRCNPKRWKLHFQSPSNS
jgi:ketosteroid isomerase-like protein